MRVARVLLAVAILCALIIPGRAFVFYLVNPNTVPLAPLRWNVNSTAVHTNVVNPTTKKVRYFIASDAFSTANKTNEINAIRASFDQWAAVPGGKLQFEEAGFVPPQNGPVSLDHTNVVFWKKSFDPNLTGLHALTTVSYNVDGTILDADIALNGFEFTWFTDFNNTSNQAQFVESIMLHEIGHFIGLDHTPAGAATVVAGPNGIGTQAGLSADEVAAMRYLYPDPALKWASISGKVTKNGLASWGAIVTVEDSAGNIAGSTVTRQNGDYNVFSLPGGTYRLHVSPFDPPNTANNLSLMRADEINVDFKVGTPETSFLATTNLTITLTNGEARLQNVNLTDGTPFRIASLSKPTPFAGLISASRTALSISPGQSNLYIAVSSPTLQSGSTLQVTGDGITMGPTTFYANKIAGQSTLEALIQVSSNATPGLRTYVVTKGASVAYANGFLEIASPVPDFNFDGLDDRFQRQYWPRWTAPEAAPTADPDEDNFSNRYEFQTGSNPTNSTSFSFLIDAVIEHRFGIEVTWTADLGKRYQLYGRPAFGGSSAWQAIGSPVTATNSTMTVSDTREATKFYRLQLLP
jgi:hypothetical protein